MTIFCDENEPRERPDLERREINMQKNHSMSQFYASMLCVMLLNK